MDPDREGYDDPLDSSVERESVEYSCKACVACTDLAIFSATKKVINTMNKNKKETLTKSHKLRSNSNRKYNQIQYFHHLEIRIQSSRDKDGSDEEQ